MGEQTQTQTQIQTLTLPKTPSSSPKITSQSQKSRKLSPHVSPRTSQIVAAAAPQTATVTGGERSNTLQPTRMSPSTTTRSLSSKGEVAVAIQHLKNADPSLARVIDAHAPPRFTNSDPPFLALAKSILYQQITHKAGTTIYNRFVSLCGGEARVCPISVLALTPPQLLQIGVSARKVTFLHDLANKYRTGILSDSKIVSMEDKALVSLITMVKGFGASSVHTFMIFTLHRPDVIPVCDVSVRKGVQILCGLEQLPRPSQMEQLCEKWRPYRSVASWYMWRLVEANRAQGKAEAIEAASAGLPKQVEQEEALQDGD
ncbi:hypothetical protein L1049_015452 [Liquidambar formosana]|uniref:HhH-GPD domain-containing protein n=1 Tax=Liquidambar formosana TaxID=63359 RepID=A0AAP0S488_LIQFO